jgi:hypothetical protein
MVTVDRAAVEKARVRVESENSALIEIPRAHPIDRR